MNATTKLTTAFALESGYSGNSPAMLAAFARIREHGIREARAAHFERVKLVKLYAERPDMFFAAIRPALSTQEAIEDANRIIFGFRNMPRWQQDVRREQVARAKRIRWTARYFRRFGARIWLNREAA